MTTVFRISTYVTSWAMPKGQMTRQWLRDWQVQHAKDHNNIFNALNALNSALGNPAYEINNKRLSFDPSNLHTINDFMQESRFQHAEFYQWINQLGASLSTYGKTPLSIKPDLNLTGPLVTITDKSWELFLQQERVIHMMTLSVINQLYAAYDKQMDSQLSGNFVVGVNMIPGTGEFIYDTIPYVHYGIVPYKNTVHPAWWVDNVHQNGNIVEDLNFYNDQSPPVMNATDFVTATNQMNQPFLNVKTVALVVAWFGDNVDASKCQIYPSSVYANYDNWIMYGQYQHELFGGGYWPEYYSNGVPTGKIINGGVINDFWRCSSLTQNSTNIISITQTNGSYDYGGTPSDQSIVRAIRDFKAKGYRVVFYPMILMDCAGFPWRGRITYSPDNDAQATTTINNFLGPATTSMFTRDFQELTVNYSGNLSDWTYRRMILHYANLCVIAGGVDLFLLGSELRGLESVRGPNWTKAGTINGGKTTWDNPFVTGLIQLSDDVRSIFDGAGLLKDTKNLKNLISYGADWSVWMGYQYPGLNGQWPILDQLYAHSNIDLVCTDNYTPLSDWTTTGGLDKQFWSVPKPAIWPPSASTMNGLGLSGTPDIHNLEYLKANIEGGEKFNWYYNDSTNAGRGKDPATGEQISLAKNDRAVQNRHQYYPGQELLANKQFRWWWNNYHYAIYDTGDGQGWIPRGSPTQWVPQSKSISFTEYGVPPVDKGTNQPNVFYDPRSTESFTPYWSQWQLQSDGSYVPMIDTDIMWLGLQAMYEYWTKDGNNMTAPSGVKMMETTFFNVWNWDARPYPAFPNLYSVWGDYAKWPFGEWLNGKGKTAGSQ